MKKIILAADGLKLSESAIDYAAYFSTEFDAHIVAAFLEEVTYKSQPVGQDIWWPYLNDTDWKDIEIIDQKDQSIRKASLEKLRKKFEKRGVHFNIHQDKVLALPSLLNESHFADAIIINADACFSNYDKSRPSQFVRNLLSDADCPVILTPGKFKPVERFVFAYDGNPASAYAIRQFTYLFPLITTQELEIVFVTNKRNTSHLPHQQLLKELLKRKYVTILETVLRKEDLEDSLIAHLQSENKNCMVIMGAYSRSAFSMWLHHSAADRIIKELNIPLFIAHH